MNQRNTCNKCSREKTGKYAPGGLDVHLRVKIRDRVERLGREQPEAAGFFPVDALEEEVDITGLAADGRHPQKCKRERRKPTHEKMVHRTFFPRLERDGTKASQFR